MTSLVVAVRGIYLFRVVRLPLRLNVGLPEDFENEVSKLQDHFSFKFFLWVLRTLQYRPTNVLICNPTRCNNLEK